MQDFDALVIGSAGIDTNIFLYGREIDFTVEANFSQNLDTVGQAGGYAARGYAALGKRVAFLGSLGHDFAAQLVLETFAHDGIDTQGVFLDPAGTARSVNLMYPDGRRKNFYDGKGHMSLRPDLERSRELLSRARLAHFNLANWARQLLPLAHQQGLPIACDLQDVVSPDDPYRLDFITYAHYLFFSSANHPDPAPLIHRFWQINPAAVMVVGLGPAGAALAVQGEVRYYPPVQLPEPVVDTNGAGDSLAVGFLASHLLDGFDLPHSLQRGQFAARRCCTLRGTSDGLITLSQLDAWCDPGAFRI